MILKESFRWIVLLCSGSLGIPLNGVVAMILMMVHTSGSAQNYFKQLVRPELSSRQKIIGLPNGDILIGDSSFEGALQGNDAVLYLTRLDECGALIWSFSYAKANMQLNFCDFDVNDRGEIFVFGTISDGLAAALFLLKVSADGDEEIFRVFTSDTPSHAAYALDLQGDQILIYGSILVIGAPRTGFVAVFDGELNPQWAKQIVPFTFEGHAIFSQSGDILARSEALHYKFDSSGQLLWAYVFDRQLDPVPIGGPYEVADGYLFQAFESNQSFFYKLDFDGNFRWQSPNFPSTNFPAALHKTASDTIIFHQSHPQGTTNGLMHGKLSSAGEIIQLSAFDTDHTVHIGSVYHTVNDAGTSNVIGNRDAKNGNADDRTELLLQFNSLESVTNCYRWQEVEPQEVSNVVLSFPSINVEHTPLEFNQSSPGGLQVRSNESPFLSICSSTPNADIVQLDTVLPCNQIWNVTLPSPDYHWDDGYPDLARPLDESISFSARSTDCMRPAHIEYQLLYSGCECAIALPNAFTPNADGINDVIEIYSECRFQDLQTHIFDRWGNLIYQSEAINDRWNGMIGDDQAPVGTYLVVVEYRLVADQAIDVEGTSVHGVTLIR